YRPRLGGRRPGDREQRAHRGGLRVAGVCQATEAEVGLDRLEQRVMVVRGSVAQAARTVAGDHHRRNLTAARALPAAAGVVVTLVVHDGDGVVALGPEARAGDRRDQLPKVLVAVRDQPLVLRVTRVTPVDAVRRVAVLVVALGRDHVPERRYVTAAQVG